MSRIAIATLLFSGVLASSANAQPPSPAAGKSFRDCSSCPEMVSIPTGSFLMGSPSGEDGRSDDDGPQRRVSVPAFAAGKYEVTWSEYNACVSDGGCTAAKDDGFGKGSRPVTNVSWNDAKAYARWQAHKTGKTYRLLSDAEWEYAARAGTTTPFSFGATISTSQANYNGNYAYDGGSEGEYRQKTTPVGTFPANAFGLHDMHGNVWEWVEDCIENSNSTERPSDGSAFTKESCSNRVVRGGSWVDRPQTLRSAFRIWLTSDNRGGGLGFRLARTLP